jgi:hypothetical protein
MRTIRILLVFGIALLFSGCVVPSLHPLFTEKDLVFDPALIGTWVEENEKETWTFQKAGDHTYDLFYEGEGDSAEFEAHLLRLGKFEFLDIYPEEPDIKNDFCKFHLILTHTFSRIWIDGDTLRTAMLNPQWLEDMIARRNVKIAHERLDDRIVLTASTKELQKFILKYAEDINAFPDPAELHRQK